MRQESVVSGQESLSAQIGMAIMETIIEKYRPSNGTEGDNFMEHWCFRCQRDKPEDEEYCPILGKTFALSADDPEYPVEWRFDQFGIPCCTAFAPTDSSIPPPRCTSTGDLFAGVTT
ncbi:MAG: hypothetical protein FWH15_06405 [Betaproteobacteria bacterium]|nr:hypothetical protein [Betaproteobacteria bacterium]